MDKICHIAVVFVWWRQARVGMLRPYRGHRRMGDRLPAHPRVGCIVLVDDGLIARVARVYCAQSRHGLTLKTFQGISWACDSVVLSCKVLHYGSSGVQSTVMRLESQSIFCTKGALLGMRVRLPLPILTLNVVCPAISCISFSWPRSVSSIV